MKRDCGRVIRQTSRESDSPIEACRQRVPGAAQRNADKPSHSWP